MKVTLLNNFTGKPISALIQLYKDNSIQLPSITDGWRFNFRKHAQKGKYRTYVLHSEEQPKVVEGCLVFEMRDEVEPYMAFVEAAPHNRGEGRKIDNVAGYLIAFACRLSFLEGREYYQGWLAFDVLEETKEDEAKLMAVYSSRYHAMQYGGTTTMVIPPEGGETLINEFLKQ